MTNQDAEVSNELREAAGEALRVVEALRSVPDEIRGWRECVSVIDVLGGVCVLQQKQITALTHAMSFREKNRRGGANGN